ncbi:MAG TPA: M23 family metallopeptidase, partial [Vampirovibrionales bacterium]
HNILVHNNDYSASDAERFNELAGELKLQKQELIPIPATEEIVLKGSATNNYSARLQTINELQKIVLSNQNLSSYQRVYFEGLINHNRLIIEKSKNAEKINESINEINKAVLLIQVAQANNAAKDGYLLQEASKHLREARETMDALKKAIPGKEDRKIFEQLAFETFWEEALIQGSHWLKSLSKTVEKFKGVSDKLSDLTRGRLDGIVEKAQNNFIKQEVQKLETEKANLIIRGKDSNGYSKWGSPLNDPPVILLDEQIYRTKNLFNTLNLSYTERIEDAVKTYTEEYIKIINMPEGTAKDKQALEFWNKLTLEIESNKIKSLKWKHVKRWKKHGDNNGFKEDDKPYYIKDYEQYIEGNESSINQLASFYEETANVLKVKIRDTLITSEFIEKYATDKETGLTYYAGIKTPFKFSDNNRVIVSAHQGSRYLVYSDQPWRERKYRMHNGLDFGSSWGHFDIRNTPVYSPFDGNVEFIEDGNILAVNFSEPKTEKRYQIVFRHIPPEISKKLLNTQGKESISIKAGEQIGIVGNYRTVPNHLHWEVFELQGERPYQEKEALDPLFDSWPGRQI